MSTRSATPEAVLPPPPPVSPFGTARVTLLPASISERRRVKRTRRGAFLAVAAAVVIVVLATVGIVALQVTEHRHQDALTAQGAALLQEGKKYEETRRVLQSIDSVNTDLSGLFTQEVDQAGLVVALRGAATGGTKLTSITLTSSGPADQAPVAGTGAGLAPSDAAQLGSVVLSGTAGNQRAVAAYAAALADVDGLTAPFVTSVRDTGKGVSFTMQGTITDAILADRFTTTPASADATTAAGSNE